MREQSISSKINCFLTPPTQDQESRKSKMKSYKNQKSLLSQFSSQRKSHRKFQSHYPLKKIKHKQQYSLAIPIEKLKPQIIEVDKFKQNKKIDEYLMQLQKSSKKMKKEMIRKSELVDEKNTFTPSQELRLELMDQLTTLKFLSPMKLSPFKLVDENIQSSPKQEKFIFDDEVMNFQEWQEKGNHDIIFSGDQLWKDKVDVDEIQKILKTKLSKKKVKCLNFQKNKNQKIQYHFKKTRNKNQDLQAHSVSEGLMRNFCKEIISDFDAERCLNESNYSEEDLIFTKQINREIIKKIRQNKRLKRRVSNIKTDIAKKYNKIECTSIMTEQRREALYECEAMKRVKKVLNLKDFSQFKIEKVEKVQEMEEISERKSDKRKKRDFDPSMMKDKSKGSRELIKNLLRLKEEKRRKIQKVRFYERV